MSPKRIKEIIEMIPKECNLRLGGSYGLYFRNIADSYRDIDIIIDKNTISLINLPFPKIEFIHNKRLNACVKYCIDGKEVDILESIYCDTYSENSVAGFKIESEADILRSKNTIDKFIYGDKRI